MLKRLLTQKKYFQHIYKAQKGITGLETAIILIAFVVVAAVFAYTVLSAGLFSTQKSQEAVYSGLKQAQGTLETQGSVVAYTCTDGAGGLSGTIGKVEFTVALSSDGDPIDLTPSYKLNGSNQLVVYNASSQNALQIGYTDQNVHIADCAWTIAWIGNNNSDYMLDKGEKAVITVWLHAFDNTSSPKWTDGATPPFVGALANYVSTYHTFTLEAKPKNGATLTIQRTTPAYLDAVNDLH